MPALHYRLFVLICWSLSQLLLIKSLHLPLPFFLDYLDHVALIFWLEYWQFYLDWAFFDDCRRLNNSFVQSRLLVVVLGDRSNQLQSLALRSLALRGDRCRVSAHRDCACFSSDRTRILLLRRACEGALSIGTARLVGCLVLNQQAHLLKIVVLQCGELTAESL